MADRPILFTGPMVKALLDGRKTQTRRVLKDAPATDGRWSCDPVGPTGWRWVGIHGYPTMPCVLRFTKGDRLWVREAWARTSVAPIISTIDHPMVVYREGDNRTDYGGPWKPGIHMPRWASRLTLTVTDVRVQRLQECGEAEAIAEGVIWSDRCKGFVVPGVEHPYKDFPVLSRPTAREMYGALWDVINGSGAWATNPWIIAVTFTVERRNIDALQVAT